MGVENHAKRVWEASQKMGMAARGDVCLRQVYDGFVITLKIWGLKEVSCWLLGQPRNGSARRNIIHIARAAKNGSAKQPSNKWINAYGSIYVGKTVKEFGWYDRQEKPNSFRWAGPKNGFSCPAPQRERDEEQ